MGLTRVGLLEKSQPSSWGKSDTQTNQFEGLKTAWLNNPREGYERPIMDAVAINSSSSASDILPETA